MMRMYAAVVVALLLVSLRPRWLADRGQRRAGSGGLVTTSWSLSRRTWSPKRPAAAPSDGDDGPSACILLAGPSPDGSATSRHSSSTPRASSQRGLLGHRRLALCLYHRRADERGISSSARPRDAASSAQAGDAYADAMRSLWTLFRTQPLLRESSMIGASSSPLQLLLDHAGLSAQQPLRPWPGRCGQLRLVGAAGALAAQSQAGSRQARHALVLTIAISLLAFSYVFCGLAKGPPSRLCCTSPYSSSASLCWTSERRWRRSPTRPASSALCPRRAAG